MEEIQVDEGFWVVVNPEPIQLVLPTMSQAELDYAEWFDDIRKDMYDE